MKNFAFLLGRLGFGGFFLYSGINHFQNRKMLAQYVRAKNISSPDMAVALAGVMMICGGVSVIGGIKPAAGAAAIAAFLGAVSPQMHDFWNQKDQSQRMNDTIHFSKNMALLAAALALMGVEEPWPVSMGRG